MNDFTTLTKAVATAEEIMREYSASTERVIKSKSATVLGQVCEYLFNVLNECDFTEFSIQCDTQPGYFRPDTPAGYCGINSGRDYLLNGVTYHGSLYVHAKDRILRVYFNHDSIMIQDNESNDTILVLCYYWKKLKANLDIAIKKSLESRLNAVKREAEVKKSQTAIIDSFEL